MQKSYDGAKPFLLVHLVQVLVSSLGFAHHMHIQAHCPDSIPCALASWQLSEAAFRYGDLVPLLPVVSWFTLAFNRPFHAFCSELLERLHHCLLGHLYHLARGELLRIGAAMKLHNTGPAPPPDAAGKTASAAESAAAGGGGLIGSGTRSVAASPFAAAAGAARGGGETPRGGGSPGHPPAAGAGGGGGKVGWDVVSAASGSGQLSSVLANCLNDLLGSPLCGFSCMVTKVADGAVGAHAYEVHTPKLLEEVRGDI